MAQKENESLHPFPLCRLSHQEAEHFYQSPTRQKLNQLVPS